MKPIIGYMFVLITPLCLTAHNEPIPQKELVTEAITLLQSGEEIVQQAQQFPQFMQTTEFIEFTQSLAEVKSRLAPFIQQIEEQP
jgi:hypothetical protein